MLGREGERERERERVVLDPDLTSGWLLYRDECLEGRERELSHTLTRPMDECYTGMNVWKREEKV